MSRRDAALAATLMTALLPALTLPAAADCRLPPEAGTRLDAGAVQLAWRAEPAEIVVGQPFVLLVGLCPADAELSRVDARMPEHRHGMNYRPSLQPLGAGRWRVEGLLWHMSGRWELQLDVRAQGQLHRLTQSVQLP